MARPEAPAAVPPWVQGAVLVAMVIAVYLPTLGNGYVSDDAIYILGTRELASLAGLRDIWLQLGAVPQYYPLVHTSFWLEYHLWGVSPVGYHAMNLASHAVVVLLAWRLLLRLAVPGAWLAAAIFAVHPVHVETVAWASERKNLYSAAFALGSMLAYLRFAALHGGDSKHAGRRSPYFASLALYVAALLCKTVTVTMPAALAVLVWWRRGSLAWRDVRPLLPFLAIGVPLALVTVWVEREHVGASGGAWELDATQRVLIAGRAVWFYLGKLAWPHPLGFVYPRWEIDPRIAWQWAYPLAGIALAGLLFALRARIGRGPLAALLLFVGILFPALGFFDVYPFLFSFVADHYQYHASLAPIALAAAGFACGRRRLSRGANAGAIAAAVACVAGLAALAHRETYAYRDDTTLIRRNAELQPDAWAARFRLAASFQIENRHEEAIAELREALRLFPSHAPIRASIAIHLAALGRVDEAAAELDAALAARLDDEDRVRILLQLANLRVAQQRFDGAAARFRAATELAPDSSEAHYGLGLVLRQIGDASGALAALRRAVELDGGVAKSQLALGTLLLESGDAAGAIAALRSALEIEPGHAAAAATLERALAAARD